MNWAQWVIPLIAVAVWILSSMVKTQQEQARRNANRTQPKKRDADAEDEEAQRRATERANRLLEEIRRRKQREAPPPLPRPVQEPAKRAMTTAQRIENLDAALDARKATMSWQDPAPAKVVVAEVVPALPLPTSRNNVPPTVTSRRPTKVGQNLQVLLKNRQTLATAFLLTEVLGPPRCMKKLR